MLLTKRRIPSYRRSSACCRLVLVLLDVGSELRRPMAVKGRADIKAARSGGEGEEGFGGSGGFSPGGSSWFSIYQKPHSGTERGEG
jgi:hypothetical protein